MHLLNWLLSNAFIRSKLTSPVMNLTRNSSIADGRRHRVVSISMQSV